MKLSICMMIKNEEKNLHRCLEKLKPLTELGLAELIIVDTGSDDKSEIIAKEYTDKVYFHEWNKNFSEMRNISISYAKGEWIFIIDADERLDDIEKLIELMNSNILEKYNSITLKVKNLYDIDDENKYNLIDSPRIFRNDREFRYEGSVHNQPIFFNPILNSDISLTHFGYIINDTELMDKKFNRTVELLKLELAKEPNNIYYIYQLGISYDMHKEPEKALIQMKKAYSILREKSKIEKRQYIYIYSAYARIAYNNAKYRETLSISKEGLKIEKDYIDFYYLAGMAERQLKNEEESISFFESYLKLYKRFDSLEISKDYAIVMYHIYDYAKSNVCFCMFNYYFSKGKYDKAYFVYKNITTVNEKIYASINILVHMEKYSELREIYDKIEFEKDKNIFLNTLENKIKEIEDNKKNDFYNEFSLIKDVYGKFNRIRIANNLDEKIELTKTLIEEIDFNKEPVFYSDIFENVKDNIKLIIDVLKKLQVSNIKNIIIYLVEQKKIIEIFEKYILENNKNVENIKEIKMFIIIANVLMLNNLNDNNKVTQKYLNIFKIYLNEGINFIQKLYKVEKAEEIYECISDSEERFFMIMYIFNKLIQESDKKAAIKYMIEAVNTYEAFSKYIDIYKDEIFNLNKQKVEQEKNEEFENHKIKIKENINNLINQGSLEEAKKIISEYEGIVNRDLEIYSMKAIIFIMENKIQDAKFILESGLEIDSNNFDLAYNLAYLYEQIGEFSEAIEFYIKAEETCSDDNLKEDISRIIDKIKEEHPNIVFIDKKNEFENYKLKFKENITNLINEGCIEESKKLISEYEKIVRSDLDVCSMKSIICIMENKVEDAEKILKEGLEIDENNFDLNYNLAYLYFNINQYELSLMYYIKSYINTENDEITKNIKETIRELLAKLDIDEEVEVFLKNNMRENEKDSIQKCLILCHFYSVYTKEFLEKVYSKTNITFDILTLEGSYKEKVKSGVINNVYTYNNLNEMNEILNSNEKYDIIHVHFLTPFYGEVAEQIRSRCNKLVITIWGSDYYRTTNEQKEQQRKLVDKADIITFDNDVTMEDFAKYYNILNKEKLTINRFGLTALEYIKDLENIECNQIKEEYNIPQNSIVVTCGYNANPAHNHLEIIKSIKQIKNNLPQNMYYIFPMTYQRDEKYCDIVKHELEKSGLKYIILEKFMEFEEISKLTKITDIMIQVQITDTLSATMQEHMYNGNIIITGSWLPYKPLKEVGAYFLEVFSVDKIGEKLIEVMKDFSMLKQNCLKNMNIIWNFSAWENTVESWRKIYYGKNEIGICRDMPLVSICIPVYNCEDYIYEAIKSAIDQTYQNIEIIISDNCSNDRTAEIISSIKDDRIKYYRHEEVLHPFDNWNYCVEVAKGKYIKYLFSDDVLKQECVEKLIDIMESNEDVVIASGDFSYISDKSETTLPNVLKSKQLFTGKYRGKGILKKSIIQNNVIGCPSNVMIRKNAFDKIKGFNKRYVYCVDDFLYYRLFELGSYYFVNIELTKFRSYLNLEKGVETTSLYERVEEFYMMLEEFSNNDLFSEEEIRQAYCNAMNSSLYSFSINKDKVEKIKIIDKIINCTKFIDKETLEKLKSIRAKLS